MSKTYNGHKNWAHWNVALWLNNDEGLYLTAKDCVRSHKTRRGAARELLDLLPSQTPDGARYSYTNVYAALAGFYE